MRPGDRRTKTMDRDPNTEKAKHNAWPSCLASVYLTTILCTGTRQSYVLVLSSYAYCNRKEVDNLVGGCMAGSWMCRKAPAVKHNCTREAAPLNLVASAAIELLRAQEFVLRARPHPAASSPRGPARSQFPTLIPHASIKALQRWASASLSVWAVSHCSAA